MKVCIVDPVYMIQNICNCKLLMDKAMNDKIPVTVKELIPQAEWPDFLNTHQTSRWADPYWHDRLVSPRISSRNSQVKQNCVCNHCNSMYLMAQYFSTSTVLLVRVHRFMRMGFFYLKLLRNKFMTIWGKLSWWTSVKQIQVYSNSILWPETVEMTQLHVFAAYNITDTLHCVDSIW